MKTTKTIRTKVYRFSALSKKAKQAAIENFRRDEDYQYLYDEASETVERFAELFSINVRSFSFDEPHRNEYTFEIDDNVFLITGQRLATYIWNNFKNDLWKGKYYSLWSRTEVSFKHYENGHPVLKKRYSKVIFENSCVLTGTCYDESILQPIYQFLNKPDKSIDFRDLVEDCFSEICKTLQSEIESRNEDEYIIEDIESNDYWFTIDGIQHY